MVINEIVEVVHNPRRGRGGRKSLYAEALLHQCTTQPKHALPNETRISEVATIAAWKH